MRKIILGGKNLLPPIFTTFITLFVFFVAVVFFFFVWLFFLMLNVSIVDKQEEVKISQIIQNENKAKMRGREGSFKNECSRYVNSAIYSVRKGVELWQKVVCCF